MAGKVQTRLVRIGSENLGGDLNGKLWRLAERNRRVKHDRRHRVFATHSLRAIVIAEHAPGFAGTHVAVIAVE